MAQFSSVMNVPATARDEFFPNRPLRRGISNVRAGCATDVGNLRHGPCLNCCIPSGRCPPVCLVRGVGVVGVWSR